jgi:hypothetical protein
MGSRAERKGQLTRSEKTPSPRPSGRADSKSVCLVCAHDAHEHDQCHGRTVFTQGETSPRRPSADPRRRASCAHTMHTALAVLDRSRSGSRAFFTSGEFLGATAARVKAVLPRPVSKIRCVSCARAGQRDEGEVASKSLEAHSIAYFPTFHGSTGPFERLTGKSTVRKRTCKIAHQSFPSSYFECVYLIKPD